MRKWKSPDGRIKLYHADCLKLLPKLNLDKKKTAVVSDPPYGIGYVPVNRGKYIDGTVAVRKQKHKRVIGDDTDFDASPWILFNDCLLFGADNYHLQLPLKGRFYFWDKVCRNNSGMDRGPIAPCEFMWHKKGTRRNGFRLLWHGWKRDIGSGERGKKNKHPTQKPITLMCWCLQQVKSNLTILDPYMGSGTTMVACVREKRQGVGIEIDEEYFEIAIDRVKKELRDSKRRLI